MDRKLPDSAFAWRRRAKTQKVDDKTIHSVDLNSASTITDEQYLMLRVLWKRLKSNKFDPKGSALGEWKEQADIKLNSYQSWLLYCVSFGGKLERVPLRWLGFISDRYFVLLKTQFSGRMLQSLR